MYQDLFRKIFSLKPRKSFQVSGGYTLVEILISMLIFGIVTISLSLPVCQSIYLTVNNENIVKANNLARLYLKDTEVLWSSITDYDLSVLPDSDNEQGQAGSHTVSNSAYTDDGNYKVIVDLQNLKNNDFGVAVVKRVRIVYQDMDGNNLADVYMDYDRK